MDWRPVLWGMQAASAAAREQRRDREVAERLERARRLLDECYGEPIDLEAAARAACLSPHHFHRLFRRHTGDTPHQYLTRRRTQRARELLLTTELSVTEVCLEVGFHSLGSFSSLFHRYLGRSPSHYRKMVVQSLGVPGPRPLLAPIPTCFLRAFSAAPTSQDPRSDRPRSPVECRRQPNKRGDTP